MYSVENRQTETVPFAADVVLAPQSDSIKIPSSIKIATSSETQAQLIESALHISLRVRKAK